MHGEYFDEVLAVQHKTGMRNVWSRAAGCSRQLFAGLVAFPLPLVLEQSDYRLVSSDYLQMPTPTKKKKHIRHG